MDFRELLKLGYYLIPLKKGGKTPLGGNGAKHKSNDLQTVENWAKQYPGCNWGIVTENIIVFDLDSHVGKRDLTEQEMLSDWIDICDRVDDMPCYPTVITGSGGRHFYFKRPDVAVKGRTKIEIYRDGKKYKTNIDIRIGDQYVVAPGSVHENGNLYECDNLVSVDELSELPEGLIDILPKQGEENKTVSEKQETIADKDVVERCRLYVQQCDPAISGQNGQNQLFKVTNAIFYGFALSYTDGMPILMEYNNRCEPPFEDWELEHKYTETMNKPPTIGWGSLAETKFESIDYSGVSESIKNIFGDKKEEDNEDGLNLINGKDIALTPENWLWEDRILLGSLTVVFGIGAVGKSSLILEWAARVTAGIEWADGSENPTGTVLYFSTEETPDSAKAKIQFWGGNIENFYYVDGCKCFGKREVFDMDKVHLLEKTIKKFNTDPTKPNVRLIILDPVASVLGDANENSNKEVRGMLERLNPVLSKYEVACIGISHARKPTVDTSALSRNRLAGSIAFANLPRTVWEIIKEDSGKCLMLVSKSNLTEQPKGVSYHFDEALKRKELNGRKLSNLIYDEVDIDVSMDVYMNSNIEKIKPKKVCKKDLAAEWLREYLSSGPKVLGLKTKEFDSIANQAEVNGFSYKQVWRAISDGLVEVEMYDEDKVRFWKLKDPTEEEIFGQTIKV